MLNTSALCGAVAGAVALVVDAIYLAIILSEDNDPIVGVVLVFAALIGLAGVAAAVGGVQGRPALLWPSSVVLIVLGVLGIFSIGLPLVFASVLAAVAANRAPANVSSARRAERIDRL